MANDIIDIIVTDNSDNVQLNVTPNLVSINVSNTSGNIIGSNYYLSSSYGALPVLGDTTILYVTNDTSLMYRWNGSSYTQVNSVTSWGTIAGTLSSQTDLTNALNAKAPLASPTFTGTVSGVTKAMVGLGNVDNTTDLLKPISTATQSALNLKYDASNPSGYISGVTSGQITTALGYTPENSANKGIANGYASLDNGGLIPSTQLPSYVDDVLEYTNLASFPVTGTTGKIYVDLATNKIYRWSGSTYIEVSPTVGTIWGGITGTLSNQTDLQNVLNAKQASLSGTGFVKSTAGTISYDTNTYLTSSSATTTYVPYTGASGNVNLGTNNISANNFLNAFSNITASGTQVVLTVASAPEIVVNGSGGQTIKLPDATTLANGASFLFNNNQSSGAILVNNNSNTLVVSVPSGGYCEVVLIDNSTAAGSYDRHFHAPSNVSWSTNTFDYVGSITSATWNGNAIAINRGGTGATSASTALSNLGGIGLTSLSATSPIVYTNTTGVISIPVATTSVSGYLSSTDWTTFNNKANALSGTTNYIPKFTSSTAIGNSNITDTSSLITLGSDTTISSGGLGIGISPQTNYGIRLARIITSNVNSTGISSEGQIQSDVTSTVNLFNSVSNTQATTFTLSNLRHYRAVQGTIGAGSTVTNQIGFLAESNLTGATNNFAFYGNIPSSSNNWNLYMVGTAKNYLNGSLFIGTTTDSGYKLDVVGTTRIQDALTLSGSVTGVGNTSNYTVTASSGSAISKKITSTLVAAANSDVLVGLDINPTFTNGSFTGVSNYALRVQGDSASYFITSTSGQVGKGVIKQGLVNGYTFTIDGAHGAGPRIGLGSSPSSGYDFFEIGAFSNANNFVTKNRNFRILSTISSTEDARFQIFSGSGNLTLQNGGTFTDAGYRLDVAGTTRFQGTTASDTAPLGSELAGVTGTGTNWALATSATNLNVGGYTHTVGSTTALTTSLAAVNGTYYQITYTITGRTAGSITIAYGGTSTTASASGASGPLASSTGVLTITPTTDFDGTVVLSIKSIGTSSASSTFANSAGTSNIEVRASSTTSNTFIGLNAGSKNTTGYANTFFGSSSGLNNTTAQNNTFFGYLSGTNNITGSVNTFFGTYAGQSNTTANFNTFIGGNAGPANTTGGNNTFIGANTGQLNTTGGSNTFIGVNAGRSNTTANGNSFLGLSSGYNTTAGGNTAIGFQSLSLNSTGNNNSIFGYNASYYQTTGSSNSTFGYNALIQNTTGSNNLAFGYQAGQYISDGSTSNAITDNSIYIGYNTKALANNQTNQIVIGYASTGLGSNTTVLGNSSTATTAIYGNLLLGSTTDAGYKLDVTGTARVSTSAYLATASGSVGIGTTSPSAKLDVNGSIKFNSIATTDYTISFTGITAGAWFNIPEVNFDGFMGLVSIFINNSNVGYGYYTRSTAWVFQEYINGTPVFDGLRSVTITPSGVSTEGVNVVESYQVYPSSGRYNMRMRFLPRNAGLGGSNPLNLQIWVDHINGLGSGSTGTLSLRRI